MTTTINSPVGRTTVASGAPDSLAAIRESRPADPTIVPTKHTARTFAPVPVSVPQARRFACATLTDWGVAEVVEDALLLVSELVTNAVTHAGTLTTLQIRLGPGAVRIDVEDLHPSRGPRVPGDPARGVQEQGRGIMIIATLAAAWGVDYRHRSKSVWAQLALPDSSPGSTRLPPPRPHRRTRHGVPGCLAAISSHGPAELDASENC